MKDYLIGQRAGRVLLCAWNRALATSPIWSVALSLSNFFIHT